MNTSQVLDRPATRPTITRFAAEHHLGRQVQRQAIALHGRQRSASGKWFHQLGVSHVDHVLRCEQRWSMGFEDRTQHDRQVVLANLGSIGRALAKFLVLSIHNNPNA